MNTDDKKKALFQMMRIRALEDKIESVYHLDNMKTPVHLCTGQEAIAVGVCMALERGDQIQSTHRSHGHYLAVGGDLKQLVAELHNRETGCSRGRGGSMHVISLENGHLGSSSIVGGGIPIATGLALANKMRNTKSVSVVFFGDGAADEGTLYESVNFAVLKKLPVIYVLEDNAYSVCSPVGKRQAWKNVFLRQDRACLLTHECDGNDVQVVFAAAQEAVVRARLQYGPAFLYFQTYRMREHAGSGVDVSSGYRSADTFKSWEARCPVRTFVSKLVKSGEVSDDEIETMRKTINDELDEAFTFALKSPFPDPLTLLDDVYARGE